MMNSDGPTGIRYRIGKSQLEFEMTRLGREEKAEMRMHNTVKQRFITRYSTKNSVEIDLDTPNVKMYETHNPGFCYKRNGECRTSQIIPVSPSVDFESIRSLLFTDGQVDIEKVLCLHLLRAHRTETLKPPTENYRANSFLTKEQSPLERLIERSRKKHIDKSLSKLLPTYILDVRKPKPADEQSTSKQNDDVVIKDGRLAARVIINDKIGELIHTVLSALQSTNPEKMGEFLQLANDPPSLTKIMEKPHIQKFINTLQSQCLIYSCDSFHLTQPFKATTIPLQMDSKTNNLANLVNHIRRTVLQIPAPSTWKDMYTKSTKNYQELTQEVNKQSSLHERSKNEKEIIKSDAKANDTKNYVTSNRKNAFKSRSPSPPHTRPQTPIKPLKIKETTIHLPKYMQYMMESPKKSLSVEEEDEDYSKNDNQGKSSGANAEYAANNQSEVSSVRASEIFISNNYNNFKNIDITAVATVLSAKAVAAHKRDLENLEAFEDVSESVTKSAPQSTEPVKVSIKKLKCAACLERWKKPLPTPKIPTLTRKIKLPSLDQSNYAGELKSGSANKLTMMIDKELKKLNGERVKPKKKIIIPVRAYTKNKKDVSDTHFVDRVHLDVLDLAKITQEIKEKETTKKLKQFLNSKV